MPAKKIEEASDERKAEARALFEQAAAGDRSRWGTLWSQAKLWKKGWAVLGFTPREIERIKVNKPDWV